MNILPRKSELSLKGKVSISLILEPYCQKCMNPIEEGEKCCGKCLNPPPIVEKWYFNRIIALGHYKTYPNENYNNIPKNIISRMILILKGNVKKHKEEIGNMLVEGLIELSNNFNFLIDNLDYILIPPKYNLEEENQCEYLLEPFISSLEKKDISVADLTDQLIKKEDTGKIKIISNPNEKFETIHGSHEILIENLNNKKILILDDIVTSKSTAWDISRALKEKNAGEINILTVGRTLLRDNLEFDADLNFNELVCYFSNLDSILELEKIKNVKIDSIELNKKCLICKCGNYNINIDYNRFIIKHNCQDFIISRYKNKLFCKHITKLFIQIKEDKGEIIARAYLNMIYEDLLLWNFVTDE